MELVKEKERIDNLLTEQERERLFLVDEKRQSDEFQVAFCGHFSAGKSTILNYLLGAEMLPTSPIPTSANIIGIKNGDLGLSVQMVNGEVEKFAGEIPWEKVREWGMNGAEIESLLIEAPLPFLGEESVIYDTPGVDSTDPTHQAVTFEALYTTDFIVYVTDYNHVQSETNLTFLKKLSDEKKPIYLVVNQIDKHEESELTFSSFDQSIRQTFKEWGIDLLALRYTSMKVKDHPLNELALFEREIKAIVYNGRKLLSYAKQRLSQGFYLSVVQRLYEEKESALEDVREEVKEKGFDIAALEQYGEIEKKYEQLNDAKKQFEERLQKDVESILKDVTIFPYTTTELVRQWLESTEPNFKVGFLFAKKKTEEERLRRLDRLVEEANDKLKGQLLFHLSRLFQQQDFSVLSNRNEVEEKLKSLDFALDRPFFENAIHHGPKSREYVYSFTKERTNAITSVLRQKAYDIIALMSSGMEKHWEEEKRRYEEKLTELNELQTYADRMKTIDSNYEEKMDEVRKEAEAFQDAGQYEQMIEEAMKTDIPTFETASELKAITLPEETVIDTNWDDAPIMMRETFDHEKANEWVSQLKEALALFEQDERMKEERQSLLDRIDKFTNQTFTISLFGAFSAGKSSFANALLGDDILPVSPHPTTATVNIVKKSDEAHQSKTATVKVKTKEQLDEEIKTVAKQLDLELSLETLPSWKPTKTGAQTMWQKTYTAYLLTLKNSLRDTKWELGSSFDVDLEELRPFVANEHDACLIHEVTLYYDCPLTEKGIVLIDTPGVNSIHGRHTNVAFKQLRDSDAIFYLNYYNHAFSRADEQFLQQMAKVNEGFRSDKIYFVLNAADLASSPYELNGVRKHVYDQLVQCGIDKPRLYPLSSKKGLEGKRRGEVVDPLFKKFEDAFYEQTISELERLSFELLKDEAKLYENVLAEGIAYITSEASQKEEKRNELTKRVEEKRAELKEVQPSLAKQQAVQEVRELFVYLRERVRFVLNDRFQEAVNVTTVVGDSKRMQQQALLHALQEWRSEGEHFLQQEIQATFVRVEIALHRTMNEWMNEIVTSLRQTFPTFTHAFELEKRELVLDLPDRFLPLSLEKYASTFQSLKSFFEEQQVRKLRDDLIEVGTEIAGEQLKDVEKRTVDQLEKMVTEMIEEAKQSFERALQREIERFDFLMDPSHHESLKREYDNIRKLIQ